MLVAEDKCTTGSAIKHIKPHPRRNQTPFMPKFGYQRPPNGSAPRPKTTHADLILVLGFQGCQVPRLVRTRHTLSHQAGVVPEGGGLEELIAAAIVVKDGVGCRRRAVIRAAKGGVFGCTVQHSSYVNRQPLVTANIPRKLQSSVSTSATSNAHGHATCVCMHLLVGTLRQGLALQGSADLEGDPK